MITPGIPAKVKPLTSKGQASVTWVQCRPIWYQTPGMGRGQVRVVGEQRLAGDRVVAGDHPAVGADAAATPHQVGHRVHRAPDRLERVQGGGRSRAGRGAGGLATRGGHDRPVAVVVVAGVELGDLLRGPVDREPGPGDLLVHVPAEVPGHRLEPGQRVDRGPAVRLVVQPLELEGGVLRGHLGGRTAREIGVHAGAVGPEVVLRGRSEQPELLLGDAAPAHRADEHVRGHRGLAHELGETTRGDVAAHVHLEEPVLGLHEALGVEQVRARAGVHLGDAVTVAEDPHGPLQPGEPDRAVGLGQGPSQVDAAGHHAGHQGDHHEDRDVGRDPRPPRPAGEAGDRRRGGHAEHCARCRSIGSRP